MSKIIVQKYGGSSLSDLQAIQKVSQRVVESVNRGYRVVVVVSAMGNTTNELLTLAKSISRSPPKRELDLLVSVGERVSMSLLAMAVQELGVKAKSFTGSQSGIITDTNHVSASIIEVRPHRIQKVLDDDNVAIVAGFQGMSINKEVTTLGRGGSDTTAVALAAALKAEYCEICSDVAGVYTTDPRVVSSAKLLSELSLDSAIAMAKNGAKVLQLEALEFAKKSGITLIANANFKPSGEGTKLTSSPMSKKPQAISFDRQLVKLIAPSSKMLNVISNQIRYAFQLCEKEVYVVDLRNLHGEKLGEEVGTISVVGVDQPRTILDLLPLEKIEFWWFDSGVLTIMVANTDVNKVVKSLHEQLF